MKMKILILLTTCFLIIGSAKSQEIEGNWQPDNKKAIFKIYKENNAYFGQLIGSEDPKEDEKIKEQEKVVLLKNLKKNSETDYCCGTFIAPKNKKKLDAQLKVLNENQIQLTFSKGFFKKRIIWNRIKL